MNVTWKGNRIHIFPGPEDDLTDVALTALSLKWGNPLMTPINIVGPRAIPVLSLLEEGTFGY